MIKLTDFLVKFFYENTIERSFNEEELLIIIYLIIEEYIIKKLLQFFYNNNKNTNYENETILYHIFKYLTRNPDVRNFTSPILSESFLKLEEYYIILSIESQVIVYNFIKDINCQINQSCTFNNINYHRDSFDKGNTTNSNEYSNTLSASSFNNILNKYDDTSN